MYSVPVSFIGGYRREPRRYAPRRATSYKVTTHRTPVTYHTSSFMPHHEFGMDPFMHDNLGMWNHQMQLSDVVPEKTEWSERIVCTGYSSDEVTLNVNGDKIQIHCVHKEGDEDDQDIREKKRSIALPDDINPDDITANMTDSGILVLTAPILPQEEEEVIEEKPKEINIVKESTQSVASAPKSSADSDNTREIKISEVKKETKPAPEPRKPYLLEVDMRNYSPESIEVKLSDNSLTVIGNEERTDGFSGRKTSKSMTRNFFIPRDVDSDRLTSKLNDKGHLIVTAPYKGEDLVIQVKKS